MDLSNWKTLAETVESVLKSGAIVIGGWWAYRKWFVQAEHEESLDVKVAAKVLPSDKPDLRILEIRCELKNVGKVPCQVDFARSTVTVSSVGVDSDGKNISWQAAPLSHGPIDGEGSLCIVPVGACLSRVHFVGIKHPGVYGVRVLFAQTEAGARTFYKRLHVPFPKNWVDNPPGWDDSTIVSTI